MWEDPSAGGLGVAEPVCSGVAERPLLSPQVPTTEALAPQHGETTATRSLS